MKWLLVMLVLGACARPSPPMVMPVKPDNMSVQRFSEIDKRCFDMATQHVLVPGSGRGGAKGFFEGFGGTQIYREIKQLNRATYHRCLARYGVEAKAAPPV